MPTSKRPTLFKLVDTLYEYHFQKAMNLYSKGTGLLIEETIKKLSCIACIEHCDRQISSIKENKRKSPYLPERFSDELVYWIAAKEIFKNKMF